MGEAARREAGGGRSRSRSQENKTAKDPLEEWRQKAEKAKRMAAEAKQRQSQREAAALSGSSSRRSESGSKERSLKDNSKSSWRSDPDGYSSRKTNAAKDGGAA